MHYRISTQPEDVTSWEPPQTVPTNTPGIFGYTYPNPIRLAREAATYLFWRGGNYNPTFSMQADGSTTWSPARTLILVPGERPYAKYDAERRGHDPCRVHQRSPRRVPDVNVYYARIRGGSDRARRRNRISGPLGTPITPAEADLVYDAPEPAWVHDVADDSRAAR